MGRQITATPMMLYLLGFWWMTRWWRMTPKLELRTSKPPEVAAWLGPTKLAKAIATITNIVD